MEIRARYTLIGLFTLSAILAGFAFVYWLNNAGGLGQRAVYQVRFANTVSGLLKGSAVLFNGIRVGEVAALELNPADPKQVVAVMAIDAQTPVRADTKATIEFQGLMGAPVIALSGGAATAAALAATDGRPPMLLADPNAGVSMTEQARSVLRSIDTVVTDNSEPLRSLITNINAFAAALAKNTDRVDGIMSGLERMTGGAKKSTAHVYDLAAAHEFPPIAKRPAGQLVIPEPEILGNLFNDEMVVKSPTGERNTTFVAKWPDTLSRVLQSRIIQSFENADVMKSLGRQTDGLKVDYQLLLDVRQFQVITADQPHADIEFSAKIVADTGKILGAKIFKVSVPARVTDEQGIAAALNAAFAKAAAELVAWTCATI